MVGTVVVFPVVDVVGTVVVGPVVDVVGRVVVVPVVEVAPVVVVVVLVVHWWCGHGFARPTAANRAATNPLAASRTSANSAAIRLMLPQNRAVALRQIKSVAAQRN